MHVLTGFAVAFAAVAGLHTAVTAHDPPGTIFPMWQWPASHLPVLDGDLSEWQVIPEEFWFTTFDLNDRVQGRGAQPDMADYNVRFAFAWNDEFDRIYMAWEGTDDYWSVQRDYLELAVDADHSGGVFGRGSAEPNRQAQAARLYLNGQEELIGAPSWNWHWLTEADWYRQQPYSHGCFVWTEPQPGEQYRLSLEMYHIWWDDFNAAGPEASVQHDFTETNIIGLAIRNLDGDEGQCCGEATGEVLSDWGLNFGDASETADFFTDWVLIPADEEGAATVVEGDTWGYIKASLAR